MRFIIVCLISLCSLGCLSCGERSTAKENAHLSVHLVSDMLWKENLEMFKEHLATNPEAARTELQRVAKTLFGKHNLAEEWVQLYFRLSQEGTKHISDVKRVSELEIQMLTTIDAKKYAKQIQHHQGIVTQYNNTLDAFSNHRHPTERETEEAAPTEEKTASQAAAHRELLHTAFKAAHAELLKEKQAEEAAPTEEKTALRAAAERFAAARLELLRADPEAAHAELVKLGIHRGFGEHPHLKKWVSLGVKLYAGKATLQNLIEIFELELQMLKDTAPETQAENIKQLERKIERLNQKSNKDKILTHTKSSISY